MRYGWRHRTRSRQMGTKHIRRVRNNELQYKSQRAEYSLSSLQLLRGCCMTYSVLGIDTTQVKETDPRTGREKVFILPKINQQTGLEEKVHLPKSSRWQGAYYVLY